MTAMLDQLRLYTYPKSSISWVIRMALAWKGVPHETVHVDIRRESDARERIGYAAVNALGQVPVLEWRDARARDGLRRLTQSPAILELLEELQPAPPLLPSDRLLRARARELAATVQSGTQPLQNNYVLGKVVALGGDERGWAQHFIDRGLYALERTASETAGSFLVGDAPTFADLYLGPMLFNARRWGCTLDALPTLLRTEQSLAALPAYRTTHPDAVA
jgi:maleylpyruvate isomerase